MALNDQGDVSFIDAETIAFGDKLVSSSMFTALFQGGMKLIEETANYLDGPGRLESKALSRSATLAYATESMRLTTRLMQLASWLLLHRAVNEGELTKEQARTDKSKFRLEGVTGGESTPATEELPETLRELIARSMRLQDRVAHIDRLFYQDEMAAHAHSPVNPLMAQLKASFGSVLSTGV